MNMNLRFSRKLVAAVSIFTLCAGFGCGGRNGLPDAVTIELPDGTQVDATLGAGVASLSDSKWEFFQDLGNGQTLPFIVIAFGPNGELLRFENNTIASEIFGDEIIFDGSLHPTTQASVDYAAATYGAETADATGFAFEGHLTAFAVGFTAATATATAQGTFDADDPDTMRGTFSFSTRINVPGVPNGNTDDSFQFVAHRLTEGG